MMAAIDEGLERLDTNYLDIWFPHLPDHLTPVGETIESMKLILNSGKLRYWGFLNYHRWKIFHYELRKKPSIESPAGQKDKSMMETELRKNLLFTQQLLHIIVINEA